MGNDMNDTPPTVPKRIFWRPMSGRSPHESHRTATTLELFFDLIFVVAIAQAAAGLHHGIAEAQLVESIRSFFFAFFGIWWAWINFTWFASAYDTDDVPYRLLVFLQMTSALIFAAAVPDFFTQTLTLPRMGVIGYTIMRLPLVVQWMRAARADPQHRNTAMRYARGVGLSQLCWLIVAFFAPQTVAVPIGILLIVFELLVPIWAESAAQTPWHPAHIIERYGLMTIIVLGESVLSSLGAIRASLATGGLTSDFLALCAGALLILFAMWWLYFDGEIDNSLRLNQHAFVWGYGHYFVFASAAAVGAGLAIGADWLAHHTEISRTVANAAVALPVALYLLSLWHIHYRLQLGHRGEKYAFVITALLVLTIIWLPNAVLLIGLLLSALVTFHVKRSYIKWAPSTADPMIDG